MKRWWSNFWWEAGDVISFILISIASVILIFGGVGLTMTVLVANSYKYNCNLDHRPSLSTAFWIDDSTYAYDPEGFCKQLKEKMANE